ncbi:hypothetical protein P280DRAFT_113797 [Massarina eburnea CBS 473.64]|uniref:Uncharacterized protein n=1 Tax=Massarina eburnea CBS 473.64 TaxID=1395130 RepID=A0A6A6RPK4_9PLEO|nr:hypothetical protein P280DRAFT_113797 [Massarina eburnea CBS 473.64]
MSLGWMVMVGTMTRSFLLRDDLPRERPRIPQELSFPERGSAAANTMGMDCQIHISLCLRFLYYALDLLLFFYLFFFHPHKSSRARLPFPAALPRIVSPPQTPILALSHPRISIRQAWQPENQYLVQMHQCGVCTQVICGRRQLHTYVKHHTAHCRIKASTLLSKCNATQHPDVAYLSWVPFAAVLFVRF